MGIEAFTLRMLCEAKRRGANFANTVTLGRQDLSLHESELKGILRLMQRSRKELVARNVALGGIADELLGELLDIERLVSIDTSDYEGATVVHDLNHPIPDSYCDSFDAVLDTGTLEHVFNYPVAIASCMKMLKVGGRFLSLTPANNHCGHGFYQFSPELLFRLFDKANGFELEQLLAIEHPFPGIELSTARTVYSVRDPALVGDRVGLVNDRPVYLFVQAVKRAQVEPFSPFPQQSDYVAAWNRPRNASMSHGGVPPGESLAMRIWRWHAALPLPLRRPLLGYFQRWYKLTFRNRKAYSRWNQSDDPPPQV